MQRLAGSAVALLTRYREASEKVCELCQSCLRKLREHERQLCLRSAGSLDWLVYLCLQLLPELLQLAASSHSLV